MKSRGPWIVCLALAALIVLELARAAAILVGAGQINSVRLPRRPGGQTSTPAAISAQRIVSAHLFGVAAVDANSSRPAKALTSSAHLLLAGTIATQDPRHGLAIIVDEGPSRVYSVGDHVGGATLYSVYLDHVILNRGGNLETLGLQRLLLSARRGVERANNARVIETLRRMVQRDPGILSRVLRAVPSYDTGAGALRGFRLYPGRNRTAFNNLGLLPGDLVTAVNGTALDDPQHGQEIMNIIETSDRATVTIVRGNQVKDVTVNIAQVAQEAANGINSTTVSPTRPGTVTQH